jgi:hypothetical protein
VLRDALTLADVCAPTLAIVCEPCGRRGRYNVQRLIAKHGARREAARAQDDPRQLQEGVFTLSCI